jgi:nucleotide-binding universal stress UspA family protein
MTIVIAAIDNSLAAQPVLTMATALAEVLGADVRAMHISDEEGLTARTSAETLGIEFCQCPGDPLEQICKAAEAADVVAVVVGARSKRATGHAGHLARQLADAIVKPVIVVPPEAEPAVHLRNVVIAMEGTPHKARGLKSAVDVAAGADLDITVLHVDDETSIPSFSDQVAHEAEAYADEFLERYLHGAKSAHLEMRIGVPADEIIDLTDTAAADLLAIGWPQCASDDRGLVAHEVLDRSHVPVLLIALDDEGGPR